MERDRKEAIYRAYTTDALAAIAENLQRIAGGKAMSKRYAEIVADAPRKADNRTGDEIAADVIRRAGLTLI